MAILLKQGSVGEPVRQLQTMLNYVLAGPTLLVVDGIFGPKTRAHTLKFQQQAKLLADGIVGPLTAKALMAASLVKLMGH